jgi:hypothetical protein
MSRCPQTYFNTPCSLSPFLSFQRFAPTCHHQAPITKQRKCLIRKRLWNGNVTNSKTTMCHCGVSVTVTVTVTDTVTLTVTLTRSTFRYPGTQGTGSPRYRVPGYRVVTLILSSCSTLRGNMRKNSLPFKSQTLFSPSGHESDSEDHVLCKCMVLAHVHNCVH